MMSKKQRPILVTGSHRSGTTWVGRVIAKSRDIFYLHEPFSPELGYWTGADHHNLQLKRWFTYINDKNGKKYLARFRDLLAGRYNLLEDLSWSGNANELLAKYWRFSRQQKNPKRLLFKDPIALFSAEWLAKRFDFQVLVLVRHPASFVSSLMRLDWSFDFNEFLAQKELMQDLLKPYASEIRDFAEHPREIIEQACLLWRIFNTIVYSYQERHPEWLIYRYKDIAADPCRKFEEIFGRLGLEYSSKIEKYILNISGTKNPIDRPTVKHYPQVEKINSKESVHNFRRRLTREEITLIKKKTADVWPLFYSEEDWQGKLEKINLKPPSNLVHSLPLVALALIFLGSILD